jgi:hypothetical protein
MAAVTTETLNLRKLTQNCPVLKKYKYLKSLDKTRVRNKAVTQADKNARLNMTSLLQTHFVNRCTVEQKHVDAWRHGNPAYVNATSMSKYILASCDHILLAHAIPISTDRLER